MSIIDATGIPVKSQSMFSIENIITEYLSKWHPAYLTKPQPLDVDMLLQVTVANSHGFKLEFVTSFDDPKIGARALMREKKIQITWSCFNKIGVNDGRSRYHCTHEASHLVLQYEDYQYLLLNPARLVKRPCQIGLYPVRYTVLSMAT
jgi:hypothetical protein